MFNIGVIGSSDSVAEVLKLTSKTLPINGWSPESGRWSEVSVYFHASGQLTATGFGNIAGEWLAPLRDGAGTGYEIRFTDQNYSANQIQSFTPRNTWVPIGSNVLLFTTGPITYEGDAAGVIRVEIRKASDHSKTASAYFTFQ